MRRFSSFGRTAPCLPLRIGARIAGARFSERPLVLSEDTITCWYHTWTYGLDDGRLRCILNDPETVLTGKVRIRTYPVTEAKGMIFTYVGDGAPPPLERDVPPTFLDDDVAVFISKPGVLDADWRLCLENAFDPGHHFIHNWSPFVIDSGFPMTFGYVASKGKEKDDVDFHLDGPGPVGFSRCTQTSDLIFEATIPDKDGKPGTTYRAPNAIGKSDQELIDGFMSMPPITVNIWLPCMNSVYNFPGTLLYYEWCVPEDAGKTRYYIAGGKRVSNEEEWQSWLGQEGHDNWEVPVVENFFAQDNMARESMQKFYAEEDGWFRERLYRPDLELTMFRKFFADHGGELQTRESVLRRL